MQKEEIFADSFYRACITDTKIKNGNTRKNYGPV